jgi:hypothetical protein
MTVPIEDWELKTTLGQPAEFYAAITSWPHYKPKTPTAEGDCEFLVTDMVSKGCIVAATMVHSRREAFLTLISLEDAVKFREALEHNALAVGYSQITAALSGRRSPFN